MSVRSSFLPDNIAEYIERVSVREHPAMRELREVTEHHPHAGMLSGADQVQLLQMVVAMLDARRTIEVGVFTGYTTLAVALALPPDGKVIACDVSDEFTSIGRPYWQKAGVAGKIDLRLAPAVQTLDALIAHSSGGFDFAYIDADKSNYDAYYERVLKLLRQGGIIAIDNVLWGGDVAGDAKDDPDTAALRALNLKIGGDNRVQSVLLSIGDGLTLARKR